MPTITPFLWFDNNAEEAVEFYRSLFDDAKILDTARYGEGGPGSPGTVMTMTFELAGQRFIALNGGPEFRFTEAISLFVNVQTQDEVDRLWTALSDGGSESQCGWVRDRFGLWWQIVPDALGKLLGDPDREKANRAMQAMLGMSKIDISGLQAAFDGAA
jgi:predicted 3-demethylubiquinone-9 3-methyltransferase (glyoxalase superfamily)